MQLHPGAAAALRRLGGNELDVARMMAVGELASPQHYMNVWLFNLRVTGTGLSYRPKLKEFVFRKPENYLTEDFLARCSGLPIIFLHPPKDILDSDEFSQRIVGTAMLPYIRGDEVWCIAKIYDAECIELMNSKQMSTSPAVAGLFGVKLKTEDGKTIFVENDPKLLDHLAICEKGVWDKDEEASGVEVAAIGDDAVAEEEKKEEKAAADAAQVRIDEVLDKLLKGVDSLRSDMASCNSRMDAWEEEEKKRDDKRKDASEEKKEEKGEEKEETKARELAADKRKDASEEEKKKEEKEEKRDDKRKDSEKEERMDSRADSIPAALQKQLDAQADMIRNLTASIGAASKVSDADYSAVIKAQARADDAFVAHGNRAPRPLPGETVMAYRRRVADDLKKYSERWNKDLKSTPDELFEQIEKDIYADAFERARRPNDIPVGKIREVVKNTPSGHVVTEFYANNDTHFVRSLMRPARRVGSISMPGHQ